MNYRYILYPLMCLFAVGNISAQNELSGVERSLEPRVVCYTRTGIAPKLGNALHLGYSEDGKHFEALNNDACVMALRRVNNEAGMSEYQRVQGVMKTLTNPYLFRMQPNGFGVVALRTDSDGQPDSTALGTFLFIKSNDLVDYGVEQLCRLPVNDLLEDISCEYDIKEKKYRVRWTVHVQHNQISQVFQCYTVDFINFSAVEKVDQLDGRDEHLCQDWNNFHNARFGNALSLTVDEGRYIKNKLGRVVNVGMDTMNLIARDGASAVEAIRHKRAKLIYSDGSTALKRVVWNDEDLKIIASAKEGVYTVRGRIFQYPFIYPVAMSNCADPDILYYKGKYYMVSTNEIDWNSIFIRSSDTLDGLTDAARIRKERLLIKGDGAHWAPELHVIGSKLYVFLAIIRGTYGVQAYMMQLKDDGDPMNPNHWSAPIRVVKPDGLPIYDDEADGLSLDMTYFEDGGKSYVCWSDRKKFYVGSQEVDAGPVLCIATVNPDEPWKLTCQPVVLTKESYSWSFCSRLLQLAEGPFVLQSEDDKIYMVYSGGGVTGGNYEVGLLMAYKGSDLLNPDVWENSSRPWMNNGSPISQVGPGHNSFVCDEYGDLYNVYHSGHRPRHTGICPIHFRFDGTPVLDMAPWEEVNPNFKHVEMRVILGTFKE